MKYLFELSLFALSAAALSHQHVAGHEVHLMRRHRHVAARAVAPTTRHMQRRAGPRRMDHAKRKTLGEGDSSTPPGNLAEGSAGAGDCAVWHTVADGEVCLGLIDKSSAGFTLDTFLKLNPSLNKQCSDLVTGLAYCVDTVAGAAPQKAIKVTAPATTTAASAPVTTPRVAAVQSSDADDDDEDLDCDDSDEETSASTDSSADSTDEEECEDETDSADSTDDTEEEECDEETVDTESSTDSSADLPAPDLQPTSSITVSTPKKTQASSENGSSGNSGSGSGSSSGSSNTKLSQSGTATWYMQNGNPGNCGDYSQDSDLVVALYTPQYDNGAHCGQKVRLVNTANGNSVEATVKDSCPSCERNGNIDLSRATFAALDSDFGKGVLPVEWDFI